VREIIARDVLPAVPAAPRRRLHLGLQPGGQPVTIDLRHGNLLIAGGPQSGKSWVTGLLCEQLILQHYCVCVIDPEGDYAALEALPGVIVLYADGQIPSLEQVELTLRYPDVCVVVDLCKMPRERKRPFVVSLLKALETLRKRTGLPHRVVVDEAHYFLHDRDLVEQIDFELGGYTLVTYRSSRLHRRVRASTGAVVVTGERDPVEAEALRRLGGSEHEPADWARMLGELGIDEAVLLPGAEGPEGVQRFRIARRLTPHVRHKHKYLELPVPEGSAFLFHRNGEATGQRALSLKELVEVLVRAPDHVFDRHLERGDFSRWIKDVFSDAELAAEVRSIEGDWRAGRADRAHDRIARAVRERYAETAACTAAPGPPTSSQSA
jgi:hypothetical protein